MPFIEPLLWSSNCSKHFAHIIVKNKQNKTKLTKFNLQKIEMQRIKVPGLQPGQLAPEPILTPTTPASKCRWATASLLPIQVLRPEIIYHLKVLLAFYFLFFHFSYKSNSKTNCWDMMHVRPALAGRASFCVSAQGLGHSCSLVNTGWMDA